MCPELRRVWCLRLKYGRKVLKKNQILLEKVSGDKSGRRYRVVVVDIKENRVINTTCFTVIDFM